MTAVKPMPTRAIGHVRVSTEGQATEGVSLAAQRDRIEAWCARRMATTCLPCRWTPGCLGSALTTDRASRQPCAKPVWSRASP